MDLKIFVNSLSLDERKELFLLLKTEILPEIEKFTLIDEFISLNYYKMTTKLINALKNSKDEFTYIEMINPLRLARYRNAGRKTVEEFLELRGF